MNPSVNNTFNILKMQEFLAGHDQAMVGIPEATHVFSEGVYARTIVLPKGSIVVGKMHRHEHVNIISYGAVKVSTFDGIDEYFGQGVFVSKPKVKRCVLALEDTCWTTIHLTNETDLSKIEEQIIIKDDSEEFLIEMKNLIGESS